MNSLEVNCFPDAGLRPSPLHHVSSASQTGTLMWPCYSKFFWTSGDLASSASPGQLCPLVSPHNLTLQLPLEVDSLPDLRPNSTFDELPKDTTSALVSSFNFPVSVLVARWVWPPHMIQDEPIALVFSGDVYVIFVFASWENETLWNPLSPEIFSLRVKAGSHLQLWPANAAAPQRPAPAPICFYETTEAFSLLLLHGVWWFFFSLLFGRLPSFLMVICLWLGISVIISFVRMAIPGQCQGHCRMSQRHLTLHFLQSFPCPS